MIALADTACVLLCAGLSRRFGAEDKLLHPLRGKPLALHAADTITALPFARRIAVVQEGALADLLATHDFIIVTNARPEDGRHHSVALGMAEALRHDVAGALLCLGDMPFVTAAHLHALADAAGPLTPVASHSDGVRSPPCLFPAAMLPDIAAGRLSGRGALATARTVEAPGDQLADFDTVADFAAERLPA